VTGASDTRLPAQEFARALLGGDIGIALYQDLAERFPTIRREDVFFGVALAWTELQAGLVAAEAELRYVRRLLEEQQGRMAA